MSTVIQASVGMLLTTALNTVRSHPIDSGPRHKAKSQLTTARIFDQCRGMQESIWGDGRWCVERERAVEMGGIDGSLFLEGRGGERERAVEMGGIDGRPSLRDEEGVACEMLGCKGEGRGELTAQLSTGTLAHISQQLQHL